MKEVERPEISDKKIGFKNEFEFCYLRHRYFRKSVFNPTAKEMAPYRSVADHMAKNTYYTYRNLFRVVGFEIDDLMSIAQIHLVSFLGLFSIEQMPEKYRAFVTTFKDKRNRTPKKWDFLDKNKANLTLFLKQRMEDVVRICRQKVRNIKGLPTEEFRVFVGTKKPPKILNNLLNSYEKYGFKRLDIAIYKSIKKNIRVDTSTFKFNGKWYVAIKTEHKNLELADFAGAGMDPYDNVHNMNPEQIFFNTEDSDHWENQKIKFHSKSDERKSIIIKLFIENNKGSPQLKEEVRSARKLLREIKDGM